MKYASSIRFGGELVSAEECDYTSYKHLGLLCPECKDPVYLRAGGERVRGKTKYQVGVHFSHFNAKDPALAAQCEKRVRQYGVAELAKRATIARNQRLKLLQRHMWSVFSSYYERLDFGIGVIMGNEGVFLRDLEVQLPDGSQSLYLLMVELFYDLDLAESQENISNILDGLKDGRWVVSGLLNEDGMVMSSEIQRIFREQTQHEVDWRLHRLICFEVLAFLSNKKSREILGSFLLLAMATVFDAMADITARGSDKALLGGIVTLRGQGYSVNVQKLKEYKTLLTVMNCCYDHIHLWIACLPWANEFDRIRQQETKASGVKVPC